MKKEQNKQPTATTKNVASKTKTVEQPDIIQQVFHELNGEFLIEELQRILQAEQSAVEKFLSKGYRVSKYGYMTLYTSKSNPRELLCPLDGKKYDIGEVVRINVRIGEKLKRAVQPNAEVTPSAPPEGKKGTKTHRNSAGVSEGMSDTHSASGRDSVGGGQHGGT